MAMLVCPDAVFCRPMAIEVLLLAMLATPIAVDDPPDERLPIPMAVAKPPDETLPLPMAIPATAPVTWFESPMATPAPFETVLSSPIATAD